MLWAVFPISLDPMLIENGTEESAGVSMDPIFKQNGAEESVLWILLGKN